jgi:hypothetical protein
MSALYRFVSRKVRLQHVGCIVLLAVSVLMTDRLYDGVGPFSSAWAAPSVTSGSGIAALLSRIEVVDDITDVGGYDRSCRKGGGCVFGPAWNDPTDHSGCDTRSRVVGAALTDAVFKAGTGGCKPVSGVLDPDPYTGKPVPLSAIDLDHIYPQRRAWDAGAWRWTPMQRQLFANDPVELIAVSAHANRSKSDEGLSWLPSYQPCTYIQRYLTVAAKYRLPITNAERNIAGTTCSN